MTGRVHISPALRLHQSYKHVILYTFDGNAIFFRGHPYISLVPSPTLGRWVWLPAYSKLGQHYVSGPIQIWTGDVIG